MTIANSNTPFFARTIVFNTVVSFETSNSLNTLCTTVTAMTVCITSLETKITGADYFQKQQQQLQPPHCLQQREQQ
jgi:hypothetical protein